MPIQAGVRYFPAIDILRGFAAYSVIMLHVIAHTGWAGFPQTGILSWFRSGSLGVDLFFVISGFVVYYNALTLYHPGHYRNFLFRYSMRRLFRIYPLYTLTLFAALFLVHRYLIDSPVLGEHLLAHLTFTHSFNYDWFSSINGVNWSIAIEVQFYILIALLTPFLLRIGVVKPVLVFLLIAWCWRWWAWSNTPNASGEIEVYRLFVLSTQLPGRLDQFGIGMLIAIAVRAPRFGAWLDQPILRWIALTMAAIAFYVLVFPQLAFWPSTQIAFIFSGTVYAAGFGAVVMAACFWNSPRFLKWSALPRSSGTISYGLYLWHLPILLLLKQSGFSPTLVAGLTLAATTLVAAVSWRFFEKPLIGVGRTLENAAINRTDPSPGLRVKV